MRVILGPGFGALGVGLARLNIRNLEVNTPEEAWAAHQQSGQPKCWLVGQQDWLSPFCQTPWQGLYHIVAELNRSELGPLEHQAHLFVGAMAPDRLADLIARLAWRASQPIDQTQRADSTGRVNWTDTSTPPPQLLQHRGTVEIPVSESPNGRWPSACWLPPHTQNIPDAPLLMPDQWQAQRVTLDALAQLKVVLNEKID